MIKISLSGLRGNGLSAIIDEEDLPKVSMYKWHYGCGRYAVYHKMVNSKHFYIYLHKLILDVPNSVEVDHINGDSLDNRKSNLRTCSHQQNMHNKRIQINNKSGYKGVCWDKLRKKWKVTISLNDKTINLGRFDDITEAAKTYDEKAKELFGEFANLNFKQ
jgi:hypothetical protein